MPPPPGKPGEGFVRSIKVDLQFLGRVLVIDTDRAKGLDAVGV